MWLNYVFLIVSGQQWSSLAQRNTMYQALDIHTIHVSRIHSLLALVFSWSLPALSFRKKKSTPAIHTVHSESIQTHSLFSHFVMLQPHAEIRANTFQMHCIWTPYQLERQGVGHCLHSLIKNEILYAE